MNAVGARSQCVTSRGTIAKDSIEEIRPSRAGFVSRRVRAVEGDGRARALNASLCEAEAPYPPTEHRPPSPAEMDRAPCRPSCGAHRERFTRPRRAPVRARSAAACGATLWCRSCRPSSTRNQFAGLLEVFGCSTGRMCSAVLFRAQSELMNRSPSAAVLGHQLACSVHRVEHILEPASRHRCRTAARTSASPRAIPLTTEVGRVEPQQ